MKHLIIALLLIALNIRAQENDSITYIKFSHISVSDERDSIVWLNNANTLKFDLKGVLTIKCSLTVLENETVMLSQYNNGQWTVVDTLSYSVFPSNDTDYITPAFMITDFDKDGNEDFLCWTHTNINGNQWSSVYINDPVTKKLKKLKTTKDEEDVWCAPTFNSRTKIITSTEVSGNYGYSYTSTYKLENQIAVPLEKEVSDNTQLNSTTGKGAVLKLYKGKKGRWKLIQKIKSKITFEED